ncbi:hypothetical protein D9619_010211 [Psilocybe cf. subviscida]|uniref:Uncharacterized protein n=1 Tax=Psilocybe cf. subviscida TaxID=2480587 RepID=A0A8H5AT07_9AGAR|nr:hypothetical protein D9619_010211 [Psilocybe cf. subviscida]
MTTNRDSRFETQHAGRPQIPFMHLDPEGFRICGPTSDSSDETFLNLGLPFPFNVTTAGDMQQSNFIPIHPASPQVQLLLSTGIESLTPVPVNIEPPEISAASVAYQRLFSSLSNMFLLDMVLHEQSPSATSMEQDDAETETEEEPNSADPPSYPNLTAFEWLRALMTHRRREETEDSDSEECECGVCYPQREPIERPRASPAQKYMPPPPYSAPPDIDRPEAHQFHSVPSEESALFQSLEP